MDLKKLNKEQDSILDFLAVTDQANPDYAKAVENLQKLEQIKVSDENAEFERMLKTKQHESKVAEDKRRFDLDSRIRTEQMQLEKDEKKRRFDLDKTEKNRRFESEKRVNDAEVSAKLAEIELNKLKFEFEKEDRTRRFEAELDENKRRLDLELQKLNLEKHIQAERLRSELQLTNMMLAEKQAQIDALSSKFRNIGVPLLDRGLQVGAGLLASGMAINAEETRILTSKATQFFKLPLGK